MTKNKRMSTLFQKVAAQFCSPHPKSLSPSPKREKGLGDEGKGAPLGYSHFKITDESDWMVDVID